MLEDKLERKNERDYLQAPSRMLQVCSWRAEQMSGKDWKGLADRQMSLLRSKGSDGDGQMGYLSRMLENCLAAQEASENVQVASRDASPAIVRMSNHRCFCQPFITEHINCFKAYIGLRCYHAQLAFGQSSNAWVSSVDVQRRCKSSRQFKALKTKTEIDQDILMI